MGDVHDPVCPDLLQYVNRNTQQNCLRQRNGIDVFRQSSIVKIKRFMFIGEGTPDLQEGGLCSLIF
uniref:Uncharacterized protein n=1 Tax=Escherichia coli TaxID=562 RepID=A0A3G4RTV4_ECOLX|nr:hypothetical protein D0368_00395 [Escherichia coli]